MKRGHGGIVNPPCYRKCRCGNPPPKAGAHELYPDPGNWFAPPGSNRSSGGGNEVAEAFGEEGRDGDLASVQAVIRVNAEQASKRVMQEPTLLFSGEGRSRWDGTSESGSIGLAGVLAMACTQRGPDVTREAPFGDPGGSGSTGNSREPGWADWGGGEARSTDEAG